MPELSKEASGELSRLKETLKKYEEKLRSRKIEKGRTIDNSGINRGRLFGQSTRPFQVSEKLSHRRRSLRERC
jgi:hypothetical protein